MISSRRKKGLNDKVHELKQLEKRATESRRRTRREISMKNKRDGIKERQIVLKEVLVKSGISQMRHVCKKKRERVVALLCFAWSFYTRTNLNELLFYYLKITNLNMRPLLFFIILPLLCFLCRRLAGIHSRDSSFLYFLPRFY